MSVPRVALTVCCIASKKYGVRGIQEGGIGMIGGLKNAYIIMNNDKS